jgi:SET domain-containing protein
MNKLIEVKYVSPKKGKGVFSKSFIKEGTIVDVAHVVLLTENDFDLIADTVLYNYSYEWEDPNNDSEFMAAISLSISQFINHSFTPNIKYDYDYDNKAIVYTAIRDIKIGEELTVNYNGEVDNNKEVWFDVEE